MDVVLVLMRSQYVHGQEVAGNTTPDSGSGWLRGRRSAELEWRDMAVQFSAALLLEVGWRESILSET